MECDFSPGVRKGTGVDLGSFTEKLCLVGDDRENRKFVTSEEAIEHINKRPHENWAIAFIDGTPESVQRDIRFRIATGANLTFVLEGESPSEAKADIKNRIDGIINDIRKNGAKL